MSINPIDLFLPSTNNHARSCKPALPTRPVGRSIALSTTSSQNEFDVDAALCGFKPLANITAANKAAAPVNVTLNGAAPLPRPLPLPSSVPQRPKVNNQRRPLLCAPTPVTFASSSSSSFIIARQIAPQIAVRTRSKADAEVAVVAAPEECASEQSDCQSPIKRTRKRKAATVNATVDKPNRATRTTKKRIREEEATDKTASPLSSSAPSKRPRRTVSTNFVRTNLRKKSRAFHRGTSAKSRRHQAFLQRRGSTWLPYKKWKAQSEEHKQNSLYIESLSAADTRKAAIHDDDDNDAGESTADELEELLVIERADMCTTLPSTIDNGSRSTGDGQFSSEYLLAILQTHFGHETFRPGQLECVHSLLSLAPMRTLLSLPTAAGKSLCALLPALILPNMTVIVSPLLSLMHDQCRALPLALIGAVWGGDMSADAVLELMENIRANKIKILFVSVEKCTAPSFTDFLATLSTPPSMIVIDEAHCLSQWSHNFRPAYLHLPRFIDSLPADTRVLAMSATCTKRTQREMAESLRLEHIVHYAQARSNLSISVVKINDNDKATRLVEMIKPLMRGPQKVRAILVYVPFQKSAEFYAAHLTAHGVTANAYHAGLPFKTRQRVHTAFANGTIRVVCATISFGMGIDIGHIDCVFHLHVPSSLESYVQEIGRCGRDGRASTAICLYSEDDIRRVHSISKAQTMEASVIRRIVEFAMTAETQQMDGARRRVHRYSVTTHRR